MKEKKFIASGVAIILLFLWTIVLAEPVVNDVALAPDTGASHYYWKLMERNQTTMLIVWFLFIVQLLLNYFLIMKRMKTKTYGLRRENYQLLAVNMLFLFVHLAQSIYFYDGLAQDVSIFSSQMSVIFVLVTMLVMLNLRRGFIFGYSLPMNQQTLKPVYILHGFVFAFAMIYTFWYHPTINTIGHLFGFLYLSLFFIQISLVRTKSHLNLKWLFCLEVLVVFHAMTVAYFVQNSDLWAMFGFGFGFIVVFTQIYSLNLKKWMYYLIQIAFVILAITYYMRTGISNIHQVLWIPIIEYGVALLIYICLRLYQQLIVKKKN